MQGPEGRASSRRSTSRCPRACRAARRRRWSTRAAIEGSYLKASRAQGGARPRPASSARPKGTKTAEGFLFPATYDAEGRRDRERPRRQAARRVRGQLQRHRPELRQAQEPDPLRRADDRLDDRARGAARRRSARSSPSVIYNRLRAGHAARDRRDDPLRREQLERPLRESELERDAPVQHAHRRRACRRRRSATRARVAEGGRQAREARTTSSTSPSRATARTRSPPRTRSSSATSPPTTPRARRTAARPRAEVLTLPRRLRLAGRALALAGDAQRRARRGRPRRLALPAAAAPAGPVRGDRPALPAAGFRGVNVTIPHKEAALALADDATATAAAIGAANTLTFEPTADRAPTTPTSPGCSRRSPIDPAGRPRSCSAPAAPRARGRTGARRRRGRRDGLESDARARASGSWPSSAGARWRAPRPPTSDRQLHVRRASRTRRSTFKALPLEADTLGVGSFVVDMVYRPGGTELLVAAKQRGAQVVTGLEILVAQGAASFERWTDRTAPRRRCARPSTATINHEPTDTNRGNRAKPARASRSGNGVTTPSRRGGSGRVLTT